MTDITLTTSTFSYNYSTNIGILTGTLATSIPSGTRIDNTPFSIAHNTVSGVSNGVPSSIDLGSNSITGGTGGTTFKIEGIANLFEVPTGYNVGDRNAVGGDIPYKDSREIVISIVTGGTTIGIIELLIDVTRTGSNTFVWVPPTLSFTLEQGDDDTGNFTIIPVDDASRPPARITINPSIPSEPLPTSFDVNITITDDGTGSRGSYDIVNVTNNCTIPTTLVPKLVPISEIQRGDLIRTDQGDLPVARVMKAITPSENYPYVKFEKNCFGENVPSDDLYITRPHPISLGYFNIEDVNDGEVDSEQDNKVYVMISANDLITLYLAIELQSLPLYVMAAFKRDSVDSGEAGIKYFVLGALSSSLFLFGSSLIYGFTGSIEFSEISKSIDILNINSGIVIGIVFILSGLIFKISAVPFHMWTPDVYEGSATPVTAFFATAPKMAAMCMLVNILYGPFSGAFESWQQIIILVSVASMGLGSFVAIRQTNIKRSFT